MILAIRTDKPEAELYIYSAAENKLEELKWQADRNLSKDIHIKIKEILSRQSIDYGDLTGIIMYKGPGSFTGLRIGVSVANTLATELDIPISGANGDNWAEKSLSLLKKDPKKRTLIPEYGSEPKTTKPKK